MRRTEVLQGVRMLKFRDVFGRCEEGGLSKLEAAELLGVSERTFRRWCRRYEEEGEAGLVDRRLGKPSPKQVPATEAEAIEQLYRERYAGFTAKHFHEHAVKSHGLRWSYAGFWVTRRSGGVVCRQFDDLDAVFKFDTCDDLRQLICAFQPPPGLRCGAEQLEHHQLGSG